MIVRRLAARRSARAEPRQRKPARNRVGRFIVLTLGSGAIAALLAIVIAGLPTVLAVIFPSPAPTQILASALFPAVGPVHKTVDVYDPPKAAPRPAPPAAAPVRPTAQPSHQPEPGQSPEPGDH